MSEQTGNGQSAIGNGQQATAAGELRERLNNLHAERGATVIEAKKAREEQGFKSAAFQLDWQHVEDLTRAIVHCEAVLEQALEADASLTHPGRGRAFVPGAQDVAQIVDALDNIADMAAYDANIGLTADQVGRAYEEAREIARLAVACWERAQNLAEGEVARA